MRSRKERELFGWRGQQRRLIDGLCIYLHEFMSLSEVPINIPSLLSDAEDVVFYYLWILHQPVHRLFLRNLVTSLCRVRGGDYCATENEREQSIDRDMWRLIERTVLRVESANDHVRSLHRLHSCVSPRSSPNAAGDADDGLRCSGRSEAEVMMTADSSPPAKGDCEPRDAMSSTDAGKFPMALPVELGMWGISFSINTNHDATLSSVSQTNAVVGQGGGVPRASPVALLAAQFKIPSIMVAMSPSHSPSCHERLPDVLYLAPVGQLTVTAAHPDHLASSSSRMQSLMAQQSFLRRLHSVAYAHYHNLVVVPVDKSQHHGGRRLFPASAVCIDDVTESGNLALEPHRATTGAATHPCASATNVHQLAGTTRRTFLPLAEVHRPLQPLVDVTAQSADTKAFVVVPAAAATATIGRSSTAFAAGSSARHIASRQVVVVDLTDDVFSSQ
jgi:hypothetical protein